MPVFQSIADRAVAAFLGEELAIADRRREFAPPRDPFLCDDVCLQSATGEHVDIVECTREVVCAACGRIASW